MCSTMKLSKRDSIDKRAVVLCPWYQNGEQGTLLAFFELALTCCCVPVSAGTTHAWWSGSFCQVKLLGINGAAAGTYLSASSVWCCPAAMACQCRLSLYSLIGSVAVANRRVQHLASAQRSTKLRSQDVDGHCCRC